MKRRISWIATFALGLLAASAYAQTSFFELVQTGTPQDVQAAIDRGANINAPDNNERTPLMLAAKYNSNREVITTLVKAGADMYVEDLPPGLDGKTFIDYAKENNQLKDADVAKLDLMSKRTWVFFMMEDDLRSPNELAPTLQQIQTAINKGAEVNARHLSAGRLVSPLMAAAEMGIPNSKVVNALIKAGADVNAQDTFGTTPLMYASKWYGRRNADQLQNVQVITTLLKAGADINAQTKNMGEGYWNNWTALMFAAEFNSNPEVITTLLKAGADVNVKELGGSTPLMQAAMHNTSLVITTLLKAGADLKARDNAGNTAVDYAQQRSDTFNGTEALKLLQKASQ